MIKTLIVLYYLNQIKEWCGNKKLELLYRGTRDGTTSKKFHEKCDDKGPTITLYKNDNGSIFFEVTLLFLGKVKGNIKRQKTVIYSH